MSAPDPKAWAMTDDDWNELMHKHGFHHGSKFASEVVAKVARRRAVAELKALLGLAYEEGGNQWGQGVTVISASEVTARLAAIEAEEG